MYAKIIDNLRKTVACLFAVAGLGMTVCANLRYYWWADVLGVVVFACLIATLGLVIEYIVRSWLEVRPQGLSAYQFSLRELQNLYEAILGVKMDRRNFRKKFFSMGLLEDTKEYETDVPHRPGKLYKFNYEKYKQKERKKWFGIDF